MLQAQGLTALHVAAVYYWLLQPSATLLFCCTPLSLQQVFQQGCGGNVSKMTELSPTAIGCCSGRLSFALTTRTMRSRWSKVRSGAVEAVVVAAVAGP